MVSNWSAELASAWMNAGAVEAQWLVVALLRLRVRRVHFSVPVVNATVNQSSRSAFCAELNTISISADLPKSSQSTEVLDRRTVSNKPPPIAVKLDRILQERINTTVVNAT